MKKHKEIELEIKRRIDSIDYDLVFVEEDILGWGFRVIIVSDTFSGKTINKRFDEVYDLINKKDLNFYRDNQLVLNLITLKEYQNYLLEKEKNPQKADALLDRENKTNH